MDLERIVEIVGKAVDGIGVAVIVFGALGATIVAANHLRHGTRPVYRIYRQHLGRSILLGLEFLVAGDIIRTVAITPTLSTVAVLAAIVLIRTFLSFSLEMEITGHWPWQSGPRRALPATPDGS
ncbi:MAG: DUF1622 domain-containing protein [Actinomycetota bacterium]|nr:DUF1622 domain-containing protein [Actinomycetota bacterium]